MENRKKIKLGAILFALVLILGIAFIIIDSKNTNSSLENLNKKTTKFFSQAWVDENDTDQNLNFLNSSLILGYNFSEQDGGAGTIYDVLAQNDGTNFGATNVTGCLNTAYNFSANDYIAVDNLSAWMDNTVGSISVWIRPDVFNNNPRWILGHQGTNDKIKLLLEADNGGVRWSYMNDPTAVTHYENYNNGSWYHIVTRWNSSGYYDLWVNGVFANSSSATVTAFTTDDFEIGRYHGALFYYDGLIDELYIFNSFINQTAIEGLYNSGNCVGYTTSPVAPPAPGADNAPNVTLNYPTASLVIESDTVNFNCSVADENATNVSLYINDVLNTTNTSGLSADYTWNLTIGYGDWNYTCEAYDNNSNSTKPTAVSFSTTNDSLINGLVIYYKFDGDFTDELGRNDGTNNGSGFVAGAIGQAAEFNKSEKDYVAVGNLSSIFGNASDGSISVWIRPDTFDTNSSWIFGHLASGDKLSLQLESDNLGLRFAYMDDPDTVGYNTTYDDGRWYHSVIRWNSSGYYDLWVNGIQRDSGTGASVVNFGSGFFDIGRYHGDNFYYDGAIDDFRGWSRLLTQTEIENLYLQSNLSGSVEIDKPDQYIVFQRHNSTTGEIFINGTYVGNPNLIEASFNGGSFQTIDATPSGNSFSGYLNATIGNGTVVVRFGNNTAINSSVGNVGVGDVFLVAGQSNAEGIGVLQSFNGAGFATMYRQDDVFAYLSDPTDSNPWAAGSPYLKTAELLLADNPNVSIMFITAASAGAEIIKWIDGGGNYTEAVGQVNESTYGSMKIRATLFFQGESDINCAGMNGCASYEDYTSNASSMSNGFKRDFASTYDSLLMGQVCRETPGTDAEIDNIRISQRDSWINNSNISIGAIMYDVTTSSGVHFYSNAELQSFGDRIYQAIKRAVYDDGTDYPEISNIFYDNITNQLILQFNKTIANWSVFSGGSTGVPDGFQFLLGATAVYDSTDIASASISTTNLTLNMTPTLNSSYIVTYASGTDVYGLDALRDTTSQPVLPFYNQSIQLVTAPNTTAANITILSPNGSYDFFADGSNLNLSWAITSPTGNLSSYIANCSYIYNSVETALNQSQCIEINWTNFTYVTGVNNITMRVTNIFGVVGNSTASWDLLFEKFNVTYNNQTFEAAQETFRLEAILSGGATVTQAIFYYNQTNYSTSISYAGGEYTITSSITIPLIEQPTNFTFGFYLVSGTTYNPQNFTQEVSTINLSICGIDSNDTALNMNLSDEETKTPIYGDIEINAQAVSQSSGETAAAVNTSFTNVTNASICLSPTSLYSSLYFNAEIKYSATNYAPEFYYIQQADMSDYPRNLTLFDLASNDSTEFLIKYQDENLINVEGAIIQLQRKYISENTYEVVEAPITSNSGTAIVHIDLNTNKYRASVVKDGELLDFFDNIVFDCENELSGECTQILLGEIDPQNDVALINLTDFDYEIYSSGTTIGTSFSVPSGTPSNVNVVLRQVDQFGNETKCNQSVISSAGSIDCTFNDTIGESFLTLEISKDSEPQVVQTYVVVDDSNLDYLGNNFFIIIIFMLSLIGMAISSPEWMVINAVVVMLIGGGFWLLNGVNFVVGLGALVWLIVSAIIIIIKLSKQEDR